jgi:hypothetical protein
MPAPTKEAIQKSLGSLERGLRSYVWLQRNLRLCDVRTNEHFQKRFDAFYRVRRDRGWRSDYFALMEASKVNGIDFPSALKEIHRLTGRIEASFASKLVATLDPSKPVVDKFVLQNFDLKLPRWGLADRESKTVELYRNLCEAYVNLIQSPTGQAICLLFDQRFPGATEISELKKIDLVLWQIRS